MFGLDEHLATLSDGTTLLVVAAVALLLGLRHATDPDHVAAVSALVVGGGDGSRRARRLGLAWGAGHATTLFLVGLPIVLFESYLPDGVQKGVEASVGVLIMLLAVRLLLAHRRPRTDIRSARAAYGIGLVHGAGGSAGLGVLLLATISSHPLAVVALAVFALGTAISMSIASGSVGFVMTRSGVAARAGSVVPAIGAVSLAFGAWYALGALEAVPYVL